MKELATDKLASTYDSHPVYSRAYVLMADPESLINFHRAFDGHIYKSKTGKLNHQHP